MLYWFWFVLGMSARRHDFFLRFILICLRLGLPHSALLFSRTVFGYKGFNCNLQSDELFDIQHLALSMLWKSPVTVYQAMYFVGKANFCANRHAQLCCLPHVIHDMLNVYHSPAPFTFPFQLCIKFWDGFSCIIVWFPCDFLFMMWLLLWMLCPVIGSFIFRVLGYLWGPTYSLFHCKLPYSFFIYYYYLYALLVV